jgi:hypothetical protein
LKVCFNCTRASNICKYFGSCDVFCQEQQLTWAKC